MRQILQGEEAMDLWEKGVNAWNAWVIDNPEVDINFDNMVFNYTANIPNIQWPFAGYQFPKGNVSFNKARFGEGDVSFDGTQFGEGDVSFFGAEFGEGNVFFGEAEFGESHVSFDYTQFNGSVIFHNLQNADKIKSFSFQYACFEGAMAISTDRPLNCVLDLVGTKTTHHVDLSGLTCSPQTTPKQGRFPDGWDWLNKTTAQDPYDASRLCRLKEISESNKDHKKAMEFNISEMKMSRFNKEASIAALVMEFLFEKLSNYGSSFTRPFLFMFLLWIGFAALYSYAIPAAIGRVNIMWAALQYSASQMFSIIPWVGNRSNSKADFFDPNYADFVSLIATTQNLFFMVLFFLIGLALRNKFRI